MTGKSKFEIKNVVPNGLGAVPDVDALVGAFLQSVQPLKAADLAHVLVDARTKARYCECHIPASKLVPLSTTDVPLDPEDQPEYRANREIVTSHYAFEKMQQDAKNRRSFSNLVAEFTTEYPARQRGLESNAEPLNRGGEITDTARHARNSVIMSNQSDR